MSHLTLLSRAKIAVGTVGVLRISAQVHCMASVVCRIDTLCIRTKKKRVSGGARVNK